MDSYLDRRADFLRDLVVRLGGTEPGTLAQRTGFLEATVRALLAGDGELMSWEVVSACLTAAGVDGGEAGEARRRWAAAEQALWDERGGDLRAAFEQNRSGKPARIAEAYQAKVPWRRLTARHPVTFEPWTVPTFAADRRLPDPATAGDIREFYTLLAELKAWAGSPRQSEIEKRSWGTLPDATISAMLQKDRWRTVSDRERTRIGYFAAACGLPETETARWVEAYERLRHVPPPDDLARARIEVDELRRRLADAQAEAEELRNRLTATEDQRRRLADAQAEADEQRRRLDGVQAEAEGLRERLAEAEELRRRLADAQAEAEELRNRLAAAEESRPPEVPEPQRDRRWWEARERLVLSAAVAALVFFAGGVGVGLVAGGGSPENRPFCFSGTLRLVGSTAFERTANALRQGYESLCEDAHIEVKSIGSNEGVRALTPGNAASTIAMHDGHLGPDSDEIRARGFRGFPVALVAFAVIAHKDTNVTGLSVQELRSIYARDGGPTAWRQLEGGADVPIRLVSRTEGSGTRTLFEELVLNEPEPVLSSRDCLRKDEIRADARTIRCERSSQSQVLDTVNRVPGAIGYAELHVAADNRRYPNVRILTLDGRRADVSLTDDRYPFVAPEVFYTLGPPPNGSPASAFLTFLGGHSARALLQRAGAPPCLTSDSLLTIPCQVDPS